MKIDLDSNIERIKNLLKGKWDIKIVDGQQGSGMSVTALQGYNEIQKSKQT